MPLSLQGVRPKKIKQLIQQVANRLSISQITDKYPSEISGGQKQRVAAASINPPNQRSCLGMSQRVPWIQKCQGFIRHDG